MCYAAQSLPNPRCKGDAHRTERQHWRKQLKPDASLTQRFGESAALAREALRALPAGERRGRALATMNVGLAEHMQGELSRAAEVYAELIAHCESFGDRYLGLVGRCLCGVLLQERGDLDGAAASYERARQPAAGDGQLLPVGGWALVGLGRVAFARDDLLAAEQPLLEGLELSTRGNIHDAVALALECLIRLRLTKGDLPAAKELAERFVEEAERNRIPLTARWPHAMGALVALAGGDAPAAARWAGWAQPCPGALFLVDKAAFAVFVRVLLAQGKLAEARAAIAAHRAAATPGGRVEILVELWLLEADVAGRAGDSQAAQAARTEARALAASVGLRRPGEAGTLLGDSSLSTNRPISSGATDTVLPQEPPVPTRAGPTLVEPLSQREQEVLRLIPRGSLAPVWGVVALGVIGHAGTFFEEVLFRGYVLTRLRHVGVGWAILISAVLFCVGHFPVRAVSPLILTWLLGGLVYGYLYVKSGSLWVAGAYHLAHNVAGDLFLYSDNGVALVQFAGPLGLVEKTGFELLLSGLMLALTLLLYGRGARPLEPSPRLVERWEHLDSPAPTAAAAPLSEPAV